MTPSLRSNRDILIISVVYTEVSDLLVARRDMTCRRCRPHGRRMKDWRRGSTLLLLQSTCGDRTSHPCVARMLRSKSRSKSLVSVCRFCQQLATVSCYLYSRCKAARLQMMCFHRRVRSRPRARPSARLHTPKSLIASHGSWRTRASKLR